MNEGCNRGLPFSQAEASSFGAASTSTSEYNNMNHMNSNMNSRSSLSPPQSVVDCASLANSMVKNKESLKVKLMQRRTIDVLVDQGIMPPIKSSPAFYEQRLKLERAKTGDILKHKIQRRPQRDELVQANILEEQTAFDPSAYEQQRRLKRARLADDLNERLAARPGPLELIKGNILHPEDRSLEQAVKQGAITFKKTCEGEKVTNPPKRFVFEPPPEESSSSDSAPSPFQQVQQQQNTSFTSSSFQSSNQNQQIPTNLNVTNSNAYQFTANNGSNSFFITTNNVAGGGQIISLPNDQQSFSKGTTNLNHHLPTYILLPPQPQPSLSASTPSFQASSNALTPTTTLFLTTVPQTSASAVVEDNQTNKNSQVNLTNSSASKPLQVFEQAVMPVGPSQPFPTPISISTPISTPIQAPPPPPPPPPPQQSTSTSTSQVQKGTNNNNQKKKVKSKSSQPKTRIIKFHEYTGPPNVKKQSSISQQLDEHSETSYELLLQQQQMFLQWQLECQQKYPHMTPSQCLMEEGSPMMLCEAAMTMSPMNDMMVLNKETDGTSKASKIFFDDETMPLASPASSVVNNNTTTSLSNTLNSNVFQQQSNLNQANPSRQTSPIKDDQNLLQFSTTFEQNNNQNQQQQNGIETTNIITCLNTFHTTESGTQSSNNVKQQVYSPTVKKIISKLEDMKVSDLKAELKRRNLPVSGPKMQLIERLKPFSESVVSTNNSLANGGDQCLNAEILSSNSGGGSNNFSAGTTTYTPIATPLTGSPTTTFIIKNADPGKDGSLNLGGDGQNTTSMLFIASNGTVVNPITFMPQYQFVTAPQTADSKPISLGSAGNVPTFKLTNGGNGGKLNQFIAGQPISTILGQQQANKLGTTNGTSNQVAFLTTGSENNNSNIPTIQLGGQSNKQFFSIQQPGQNPSQVIHQLLLYPTTQDLIASAAKQRSNSVPSETFHQLQRNTSLPVVINQQVPVSQSSQIVYLNQPLGSATPQRSATCTAISTEKTKKKIESFQSNQSSKSSNNCSSRLKKSETVKALQQEQMSTNHLNSYCQIQSKDNNCIESSSSNKSTNKKIQNVSNLISTREKTSSIKSEFESGNDSADAVAVPLSSLQTVANNCNISSSTADYHVPPQNNQIDLHHIKEPSPESRVEQADSTTNLPTLDRQHSLDLDFILNFDDLHDVLGSETTSGDVTGKAVVHSNGKNIQDNQPMDFEVEKRTNGENNNCRMIDFNDNWFDENFTSFGQTNQGQMMSNADSNLDLNSSQQNQNQFMESEIDSSFLDTINQIFDNQNYQSFNCNSADPMIGSSQANSFLLNSVSTNKSSTMTNFIVPNSSSNNLNQSNYNLQTGTNGYSGKGSVNSSFSSINSGLCNSFNNSFNSSLAMTSSSSTVDSHSVNHSGSSLSDLFASFEESEFKSLIDLPIMLDG